MAEAEPCVVLVLAAGGSSRMGRSKQLQCVEGEPLVHRAARIALEARLHAVVVVLGAEAGRVRLAIAELGVCIVENPHWKEGLASSLRAGIAEIESLVPDVRGVIIMPADQPRLTAAHLRNLEAAQQARGATVVASDFGDHRGPPAWFGRLHFPALKNLRGDVGARELLQGDVVELVAAPPGSDFDVDRPADLERLRSG